MAPTLVLAIFSASLIAASGPPPSLEISVTGLRSMKGNVLTCVTATPKYFPNCSKDPQAAKITVSALEAKDFKVILPRDGTYAIALLHDENSNRKLDKALFIPKEGFGFSNNPAVVTGPPKFQSAAFKVAGDTRVAIKMKYMF